MPDENGHSNGRNTNSTATVTFLAGVLVRLPHVVAVGDIITEADAADLNHQWAILVMERVRWWRKTHPRATAAELQAQADIAARDCELTYPRRMATDPIETEALTLARELLRKRLAAEGHDEPKNIDDHARALLDAYPAIYVQAEAHVVARYETNRRALELLGVA